MIDVRSVSRRRLLQMAGGATVISLAGCAGSSNGNAGNSGSGSNGTAIVVHDTVVSGDGGLGPGQADCQLTSQFYRGQKAIFRVKVINPKTDKEMTDKDLKGVSIDIKSRSGQTIQTQYRKHGNDTFWIGSWNIPKSFPAGTVDYTIAVKGEQANVVQFAVPESKVKVLKKTISQVKS